MLVNSQLVEAAIENVSSLPSIKPKGKMVYLTTDDSYWISNGTKWLLIDKYILQDFTQIKSLFTADQQYMGHIYDLNELATDLAYYKFLATGTPLITDETGTYTLTNTNVVICDGTGTKKNIYGSAIGAYFGGTAYFDQATLWDGLSNNMGFMGIVCPDDGAPGTNSRTIIERYNDSNNYIALKISTVGYIYIEAKVNGTALSLLYAPVRLIAGTQTAPTFLAFSKDDTNGITLWVDGVLVARDPSASAKANFSTTTGYLTIGAPVAHTAGYMFEGSMDMLRFRGHALTQREVDSFIAVRYEISTFPWVSADLNFTTLAKIKDSVSDDPRQFNNLKEVCRNGSYIYVDNTLLLSNQYLRLELIK